MEDRKWENLEMDCLVNVLGRVGIESLLLSIPFVCKSWHDASLNPLCWKILNFPYALDPSSYKSFLNKFQRLYRIDNVLSNTGFIKLVISRSCKHATMLVLPCFCTRKALHYAADECPSLQILGLPEDLCNRHCSVVAEVIGKWKNLEVLILEGSLCFPAILPPIGLNCKLSALQMFDNVFIDEEKASALVTLLPNIKHLYLRGASIDRKELVTILQGCKELVTLDVRDCEGFEADDKLLELASHIPTFKYEGSRLITPPTFDDIDRGWFDDRDFGEWSLEDIFDDDFADGYVSN